MRIALVTSVLLSFFLVSCSALGYVPQVDLLAARSERDAAQAEVADLQRQITVLQGRLSNSEAARDLAEERLSRLICPDRTIGDFLTSSGALLAPDAGEYGVGLYRVYTTQWLPVGQPWSDSGYQTILLVDDDGQNSLILDTRENCVIPNPDFWGLDFFR